MNDPSSWVSDRNDYDVKKHRTERQENGFSTYDWWNFCDYMAWVNIQGLEKFKAGHGYPGDLENMDAWLDELNIMIEGFKAHLTLAGFEYEPDEVKSLIETRKRGLELYAKRFPSLWD